MLTIIFWDNGVKGYIARSSIDRPPNDEEEIILMNKKEYPSLKPFQQMDFIDDQTDCEDDDKVTTTLEIAPRKGNACRTK